MPKSDTQGTFEEILVLAKPEQRPICESLRVLVTSLHPAFVQVVWPRLKIASFGVGPKKMSEHYVYIAVSGSHVNLGFYHGTSLTDPEGLLEGTGKTLRHVKIFDLQATHRAALRALVREAIEDRQRASRSA